jgi:hypothetical protein
MARRAASQRLDAALAASGHVEALSSPFEGRRTGSFRDSAHSPQEPTASEPYSKGGSRATGSPADLGGPRPRREGEEAEEVEVGLEALLLLGSAAVDPPDRGGPSHEALLSRQRGLEDRLESMEAESIRTRSLLREVEAIVSRAMDGASELDDADGPLAPAPTPPPSARSAAAGGRLPPSRPVGGGKLSARATAPATRREPSAGTPSGGGSSSGEGAASSASVEDVRAMRLLRCDMLSAQLQPLRGELDGFSSSLSTAAEANASLAARVEDALTFSAADLAAELAAQANEGAGGGVGSCPSEGASTTTTTTTTTTTRRGASRPGPPPPTAFRSSASGAGGSRTPVGRPGSAKDVSDPQPHLEPVAEPQGRFPWSAARRELHEHREQSHSRARSRPGGLGPGSQPVAPRQR